MISLNRATIIGNVTRDPEIRYTPNGQSVASFGVATNRRWKDPNGQQQEATDFHDIVAWGKLAEIIQQIIHKGNKIYVDGRIQTRSWEGQDGVKRNRTEIVMENFIPLTPKGGYSSRPTEEILPEPPQKPAIETPEETAAIPPKKTKTPPKKDEKPDEASADDVDLSQIPF
jgi:single-strand DNA-binding protein